ncbi:MAG TPA: SAM-dependent methyltransferase [Kofleriaceae bacterium]|nr:SAM-dependent methyltransferase [Kofleriaceae bacterium]
MIWWWQERWFEEAGLDVWTGDVVPHHINTSSFSAVRHARIAVAWVRSLDARPTEGWLPGRSALPVIEFGAGNGLFAHRFLRAFRKYIGPSSMPRIRYMLSDLSEARLAALRAARPVQEAEARGELQLMRYAIGPGHPLPLERLDGLPLLAIANYVFDGLPADAYEIEDGELFALTPQVRLPADHLATEDPLSVLELDWEREAIDPVGCRDAALMRDYLALGCDGCALVPRGALTCLEACLATRCQELLVLAADRGTLPGDPLVGTPLTLVWHGSFSIDVNFDVIARWVGERGGEAMATRSPGSSHVSLLGLVGASLDDRPLLRDAWLQGFDELGPNDYLAIKNAAIVQPPGDVWTVLSFLRLSGHDERLWLYLLADLVSSLERHGRGDAAVQQAVRHAVEEVRANALLDPHGALEFGVAQVCAALGDWQGAVQACRASLAIEADDDVEELLELCQHALDDDGREVHEVYR